ncbi:hypothetical protein GH714_033620 [Hevea brasiliensis]|uniref:Retrotransposon gag domain-containing protein n=1 Tax=Hevea brasiliensis TaxID=3981 RepID=A0A6A6NDX5_HEVBR|nr:hypothetical protein GH714_033620 [Hevea brasiliensis]
MYWQLDQPPSFDLSFNQLSGNFQSVVSKLTSLKYLLLSGEHFSSKYELEKLDDNGYEKQQLQCDDRVLDKGQFGTFDEIVTKKLYSQPNHARLFEIEYEIAGINQDDRDVRTFHSELLGLWTELDMVSMSLVDKSAYADLKKERDRNRVLQFLVKLRPEFENIRATIVNLGITDFDSVLGEILRRKLGCKLKLI